MVVVLYNIHVYRYMAANQRCKFAEDTIQTETENMEQLSKMVEEKVSEVRT